MGNKRATFIKFIDLDNKAGIMDAYFSPDSKLLATGCDWLKDYFVTRPEEKEKLKVCQDHPKSK